MRRSQKPWQEKLDSFALAALDAQRHTRDLLKIPSGSLEDVISWLNKHKTDILAAHKKFPRTSESARSTTVTLDKAFVKFIGTSKPLREFNLKAGKSETDPFMADTLEITQKLFRMLEKKGPDRALIYFIVAFVYTIVRPMVADFRKKQFGPEPLDWEKKRILAAMCLEFVAELLRGRVEAPKGRINMKMIKYINFVQEHQTEPLTDRDLHDALAHAGFAVPLEDHSWSVFLNRARKRGLVDKPKRITAVEQNPRK